VKHTKREHKSEYKEQIQNPDKDFLHEKVDNLASLFKQENLFLLAQLNHGKDSRNPRVGKDPRTPKSTKDGRLLNY